MIVHVEASIPPNFFDSSRKVNNFESVSERVAKILMADVMEIPFDKIKRGKEDIGEPDYVVDGEGYEVTFAADNSQIVQLKGRKKVDGTPYSIEDSLNKDIVDALERKKKKKYSCDTSIIILLAETFIYWYAEFVFNTDNLCSAIGYRAATKKRNQLFEDINGKYISNSCFKNVYILMPNHEQGLVLFDIKGAIEQRGDFYKKIDIAKDKVKAFLTYKVTQIDEKESPGIIYKISIINYVKK